MPVSNLFDFRSLRSRILAAFVGLVTVVIAVVLVVQTTRERRVLLGHEETHGLTMARSLAAAAVTPLLTYNYVSLQQLSERAAQESNVEYVVILDKEGTVAAFSEQPQHQGEHLEDPVSLQALAAREPMVQHLEEAFPGMRRTLDVAVPVFVEGSAQKWGTVRVGLALAPLYTELNHSRAWVLGSGMVVLLLAFFVARWLSRRITGPMERLTSATAELAKGNFDHRIGLDSRDEIGNLSRQFDRMSDLISEKQEVIARTNAELAELNAGLEEKVAVRARELAEAEKKYRLLFEQSPNAICIIQEGWVKFFNEAFRVTFGLPFSEEDQEWPFLTLVEESTRDEVEAMLKVSTPTDGPISATLIGRHPRGTPIHLDLRAIWVTYEGAPALEAILVDVTEQKHVQDQIVASERLRALGEMAGGVAHDFNNVLGAILGRAQLLQRREVDEETARGLRIIEKAAQDGSATVQRIQEFSRVRTDQEFAPIDLNAVLEDVIEMSRTRWQDEAQRTGKTIQVKRAFGEIPGVDGNISELRELFMNFILNAVDAITETGTITVATDLADGQVEVRIADTGCGMTEEIQRKLFDPFFTTKGASGVGLGMSIAYGMIQRHGGTVKVKSAEKAGTTFRIRFPVSELGEVETVNEEELIGTGQGRILVVDDESEIRDLVHDVLVEGGYEVVTAAGGGEALEKLKDDTFDLVITDLGMPGMSGWDVVNCCRELRPGMAIALLTGWGATVDAAKADAAGIDRVMKKPFDMMDLLTAARELVDKARMAKSA